ncbi:MAG: ABC transporter ATP-binding protein [Sarcina sp.]
MKKPVIEFRDFSFKYRTQAKETLKNINLTIYEGEKVLIVGPSGSGKSTISNCINGLVPFLYKGEITGSLKIDGIETNNSSVFELSNHVGTVLQDPDSQFIGLTAAEDIAFKLENDCVSQQEMKKKVTMVSEIVGINNYLDESPYSLSGGQKQRVTLAGVMVNNVNILLFDEPLASLDPATGKKAIELIDSIHKDLNKTIIIVEHRLEDVLHCDIDRIIVVSDGQVVLDTTPNNLLASNVLKETGIREPLYLSALKYMDCDIKAEMQVENINKIILNKEKLNVSIFDEAKRCENAISKIEEPLLTVKNINFAYEKGKSILNNISFTINKGEIVSIIGKNGAGKSTISKIICGFYKPTSGEILLNNTDLTKLSIKERAEKIGMVMQNPNQMISKPMIFDEVALGLRARGVKEEEIKERVFETLKICGLYEYRNWPVCALSFGQKKRVTIASILVLKPEMIILDEPTAGQDFKHYTEIMEFLKELNNKGVTIILITHDMHLMLEYADRAIVFSDGEKIAQDVVSNVLTDEIIIEKANLKETSLYELGVKLKLENPKKFVRNFIDFERRNR